MEIQKTNSQRMQTLKRKCDVNEMMCVCVFKNKIIKFEIYKNFLFTDIYYYNAI